MSFTEVILSDTEVNYPQWFTLQL